MVDWNISERELQVVGASPRIAPLDQDALGSADAILIDEIRRAAGGEPVTLAPEYFRTMIRHPRLFRGQMELGTVLFEGELPPLERELAVLRVAWLCGAPYEWAQHVGIAKRLGMTSDTIDRTRQGCGAEGWSAHERAILVAVEELLEDKAISDATWNVLARRWDEAQLIEFPMMVGQYVATAFVQNSLRIRLEGCEEGLARR